MSNLGSLPEALRAELVKLTPEQVRELAFDVHIARMHARQASYPSEPAEALPPMAGLAVAPAHIEVDDAVHHVMSTLVMLRLALIGGDDEQNTLDQIDVRALVYFCDDAISILRDHDQHIIELRDRMRKVQFPLKK